MENEVIFDGIRAKLLMLLCAHKARLTFVIVKSSKIKCAVYCIGLSL